MLQQATFVAAALVFGIGLYGVVTHRDMIRICVCLSVMESALIMTLVGVAFRAGATAPIVEAGQIEFADPIPHALALTAIVIGAGVLSLALALTVVVHRRYGTTDIRVVFRRRR